MYYSCAIGLRKPELEIFQRVINDNGLKPSETLYIDDSIQHVEGAARVGLISVQYNPSESLEGFIQRTIERVNQPSQNTPLTTSLTGPG